MRSPCGDARGTLDISTNLELEKGEVVNLSGVLEPCHWATSACVINPNPYIYYYTDHEQSGSIVVSRGVS